MLQTNCIINVLVETRDVLKDKKLKFLEYPGDIHIFSHFVIRVKAEKNSKKDARHLLWEVFPNMSILMYKNRIHFFPDIRTRTQRQYTFLFQINVETNQGFIVYT